MGEIGSAPTTGTVNNYAAGAGGVQAIGGIGSLGNGIMQSRAFAMQGGYQRRLADINATMSNLQAADAVRRGAEQAGVLQNRGKSIAGQQVVAQGASGTDVGSGTNAAIQGSTQALSRIDQLTAENNAALEALGFKMQATNLTAQGRMAQIAGRMQSNQSLISGGLGFAKSMVEGADIYDKYHIKAPISAPLVTPQPGMSGVDSVSLPNNLG